MSQIRSGDRAGIERAYPREAYEQDAAENARPKATLHHGIRIEADPDDPAGFRLTRSTMHVGEAEHGQDAVFLFPVRVTGAHQSTGYSTPESWADAAPDGGPAGDAYADFITRITEVMADTQFADPIGADEERLRGPHGG